MLHGEKLPTVRDCSLAGSGGFGVLVFWISSLFRCSRLGFRISCLMAAAGRVSNRQLFTTYHFITQRCEL